MVTWKEAVHLKTARWAVVFCVVSVLLMVFLMPLFYREIITPRKGYLLNDILLDLLTPVNWSIPIFVILYVAVAQTVISYFKNAEVVILGAATYCAVNLLRAFAMYLITLEPPPGMILLTDPISSSLYPDSGFAKDLFFSGHVSTIFIMVLIEQNRAARAIKMVATVIVGFLLAWQHVHYSIDLLAAPLITYWVFRGIRSYLTPNPG